MTDKIEVEEFKKLIMEMHKGFPNYMYTWELEKIIKNPFTLLQLIKQGVIMKLTSEENAKPNVFYSLGVNALPLVSAWETEKLTKSVKIFTVLLVTLTIVITILTAFLVLKG